MRNMPDVCENDQFCQHYVRVKQSRRFSSRKTDATQSQKSWRCSACKCSAVSSVSLPLDRSPNGQEMPKISTKVTVHSVTHMTGLSLSLHLSEIRAWELSVKMQISAS